MLASKNENNLSYKQSLDYIVNTKGKKTIILGLIIQVEDIVKTI